MKPPVGSYSEGGVLVPDWRSVLLILGFPGGTSGKESACQWRRHKRHGFDPWVRKIPWRRSWQPTPVFLPGESHGQGSLTSYSPWSCKESDTTEACTHLVQACSALSALGWRLAASASSLHSALFAALCLSESHHGVLEGGSRWDSFRDVKIIMPFRLLSWDLKWPSPIACRFRVGLVGSPSCQHGAWYPGFLAVLSMSTPRDGVTENTLLFGWTLTHTHTHTHTEEHDLMFLASPPPGHWVYQPSVQVGPWPSQVRKCKTWLSPSSRTSLSSQTICSQHPGGLQGNEVSLDNLSSCSLTCLLVKPQSWCGLDKNSLCRLCQPFSGKIALFLQVDSTR